MMRGSKVRTPAPAKPVAAALVLILLFAAAALAQPGDRIRFNDQDLWLSGGNVAWVQFAQDIGPGHTNLPAFRQAFEDVRDNGGNAMRFWLHINGTRSPEWSGSTVVGPGEGTIDDLRDILDLAWENNIGLLLCLWSHDMLNIGQNSTEVLSRNEALLRDPNKAQSYIDSALVPVVTGVAGHPAIIAWEIFNEPEGISNEHGWATTRHVPMANIQRFVNMTAGTIHRADSTAQVTNGAWAFISTSDVTQSEAAAKSADDLTSAELATIRRDLSRKYGREFSVSETAGFLEKLHSAANYNYYRDDRLIAAGGDPDGTLDFYTVHYYTWAGTELSPFHHPYRKWNLDKPMVIGEFFLPSTTFGVPADSLYEKLYAGGYAGALAWQWYDWWTDRVPERENWPRARANMRLMQARYPGDVVLDRGLFIARFEADPQGIEEGQTTTLSWAVYGAASVTLDGVPVDSTGSLEVAPAGDTTFTLVAIDAEGARAEATVTIEVLDPDQVNRARQKPVVASSGEPGAPEQDPNRAVDGDPDTRWSSAWEDDEWIYVDLGDTYSVDRVRLLWEVAYGSSYNIDVSLDGLLWTSVHEERAGDGGTDEIAFEDPPIARYVRMHGLVRATQWGFSLWEFEVYGLLSQARPPNVAVTAPFEGAIIEPGSSVTISAEAGDEDGTITQVQFFVTDGLVGSADAPPYELALDSLEEGEHLLSAVATDDGGLAVSSTPFAVYVVSTSEFTRYEFEDADLDGDVSIESDQPRVSRGRYVYLRDSGTITFDNVYAIEAGDYLLVFGFHLPFEFKAQYLYVNGDLVGEPGFDGPTNRWQERGVMVSLDQGLNSIVIEKYWGWMYFDYLAIDSPTSPVAVEDETIPQAFSVRPNYPNPFSRSTVIGYELPAAGPVRLDVFAITGEHVATLVDELQPAGRHEVRFEAGGLASGIYLYRVTAGGQQRVGRLTLTQ